MTAVPALVCDQPGCLAVFVGVPGEFDITETRWSAQDHGWTSVSHHSRTTYPSDYCPGHSPIPNQKGATDD